MQKTTHARVTTTDDWAVSASSFDPDLVEAVTREATRDAANVALFLSEFGFVPTPGRPVRLPTPFLLQLGAALRLLVWEASGLSIHRDDGLPTAEQAIRDAFAHLKRPAYAEAQPSFELPPRVVALFADRFAWHGYRDLDADIVLDDLGDEDVLVDALAALLWQTRHA